MKRNFNTFYRSFNYSCNSKLKALSNMSNLLISRPNDRPMDTVRYKSDLPLLKNSTVLCSKWLFLSYSMSSCTNVSTIMSSFWNKSFTFAAAFLTVAFAACGEECEKKGGKCAWKSPGDGYSYDGICREGKWGEGELCYCGYCYVKKCEQTSSCRGICQQRKPRGDYVSNSYCDK